MASGPGSPLATLCVKPCRAQHLPRRQAAAGGQQQRAQAKPGADDEAAAIDVQTMTRSLDFEFWKTGANSKENGRAEGSGAAMPT
jgi:hypothetical protein